MPYEYRKLTPDEREKLVQLRKQRGYPLHAPPHPFREAGSYLITAAIFEHAHVMVSPERRTEFQAMLLEGFRAIRAEIIGWVVLENHYHVLANVAGLDLVSSALKQVHGSSSRQWNLQDGLTGRRKVWYYFFDRLMRSETQLSQTLSYIHHNLVKHGYVHDAYDWPWSSLFMYSDEHGGQVLRERGQLLVVSGDLDQDWDV